MKSHAFTSEAFSLFLNEVAEDFLFFLKNQDLTRENEPRATALRNERVESPTEGLAPVSPQYFEKFFWLNDGNSFKRSPYVHKENLRKIMHKRSKKKRHVPFSPPPLYTPTKFTSCLLRNCEGLLFAHFFLKAFLTVGAVPDFVIYIVDFSHSVLEHEIIAVTAKCMA